MLISFGKSVSIAVSQIPGIPALCSLSVPGFIAVSLAHDHLYAQFVDFMGTVHHEVDMRRFKKLHD